MNFSYRNFRGLKEQLVRFLRRTPFHDSECVLRGVKPARESQPLLLERLPEVEDLPEFHAPLLVPTAQHYPAFVQGHDLTLEILVVFREVILARGLGGGGCWAAAVGGCGGIFVGLKDDEAGHDLLLEEDEEENKECPRFFILFCRK